MLQRGSSLLAAASRAEIESGHQDVSGLRQRSEGRIVVLHRDSIELISKEHV